MGSLNIASLTKHLDELKVLMANEPLEILAINESRLDISIPDFHIDINGYNLIRRDRNRNGGGVCVFIRKSIEFKHRTDLEKLELEMIALSIKKPNSKAFLVTAWYRPPNSAIECFDIFEDFLTCVDNEFDDIYVMGI